MAKQHSGTAAGQFELYGEQYALIEPHSCAELMQALQVRDMLQSAVTGLPHGEAACRWEALLQRQTESIQAYLASLGEFDNACLVSNIAYLTKQYDLRTGDLEKLLGISAGYISRTAKENSPKKMSIDVVWKIARLFSVDLRALLESDLKIPDSNTEMAEKFLRKVLDETAKGLIEWLNNGGFDTELDESLNGTRLITEEDDQTLYHPMRLNPKARFLLADNIFACENITREKEVLIIPFRRDGSDKVNYDFVFRWSVDDEKSPDYGRHCFLRMFNTVDDPFGSLDTLADQLYQLIKRREFDTRISPAAKEVITKYLAGR